MKTLLKRSDLRQSTPSDIIRERYISRITDDSLRAQVMAKYFPSPASDPAPPEK